MGENRFVYIKIPAENHSGEGAEIENYYNSSVESQLLSFEQSTKSKHCNKNRDQRPL